jgi:hypothetical protein
MPESSWSRAKVCCHRGMLIIVYLSVFSSYIVKQAGTLAIRARRKVASERDFLDAVEKVVRQGTKFSSTYVFSFFNDTIDDLL